MITANKVLVVDDDAPTCELIREVLNAADIEACGVTDSTKAAVRLTQQHYDAVFLDAKMPSPDGLELTRMLRSSGPNKSSLVVMITGDQQKHFLKRAFEAGVNFVLFKPVDRQGLLRLLRVTQGLIDRERRRFTRVNVSREVLVTFGDQRTRGITENVSVNGILAKLDCQFPAGSRIRISLDMNAGEMPLRCEARVVRLTGGNLMALELENVAPTDSERLQEFLAALMLHPDPHASPQVNLKNAQAV
jgi:CheY-like chemotaxis protein